MSPALFPAPLRLYRGSIIALGEELCSAAAKGNGLHVAYVNAHVLDLAMADQQMRTALEAADIVYCDGYGAVLALALFGERNLPRFTALDFVENWLQQICQHGLAVGIIGGKSASIARAIAHLQEKIPGLVLAHVADGYTEGANFEELRARLARAAPHLLINACGSPRQEILSMRMRQAFPHMVLWNVGGLLNYYGGEEPKPPRLPSQFGLEWAYRLAHNPRGYWRRYLLETPRVLAHCARIGLSKKP